MTGLILRDSEKIQLQDAERQNCRRERTGQPLVEPLYETVDVEQIFCQMRAVPYKKTIDVADGIQATWAEAGHMLGSLVFRF